MYNDIIMTIEKIDKIKWGLIGSPTIYTGGRARRGSVAGSHLCFAHRYGAKTVRRRISAE